MQSRLLELFDNRDGTLSLFGTILDFAGNATAAAPGTAGAFSAEDLASVGRTLAYNDTQTGARACDPDPCGEGEPNDRNVELLIADPRRNPDEVGVLPGPCANPVVGTHKRDKLTGTEAGEAIRGLGGADRLHGKAGDDCLRGGRGSDRLGGGQGVDTLSGGPGRDRFATRDKEADVVRCGPGRDRVSGDNSDDVANNCERVRRRGPL
jgi:Ca2+-binding RTX toxin-like protein